jgi:hypothetical protein
MSIDYIHQKKVPIYHIILFTPISYFYNSRVNPTAPQLDDEKFSSCQNKDFCQKSQILLKNIKLRRLN